MDTLDGGSTTALAVLVLGLLVYTLLSLTQGALTATQRASLKDILEEDSLRLELLHRLLEHARRTKGVIIAVRALSAVAAIMAVTALSSQGGTVSWVWLGARLFGLLALLAVPPPILFRLGQRHWRSIAPAAAPWVYLFTLAAAPVFALQRKAAHLAISQTPLGESPPYDDEEPTDEIVNALLPLDEEQPSPDPRQRRMIQAILRMEEKTAREVMVPRVDLVAFPVQEPLTHVVSTVQEKGNTRIPSRIPVYEESIDHVVGILHVRDLMPYVGQPPPRISLRELARQALFIPETKGLTALLREFQERRVHIAIVVDEHGGTSGLITLEDVLEEIVGEIVDEFETDESEIQVIDQDEAVLDGRVSLETLKELFKIDIEGEGFDTVGGFVYSRLGKIPSPGDTLVADGLSIEVITLLGRRIKKVRVIRKSEGNLS